MIHVLGTIKAWRKKGAALIKCNEALKAHNKAIEINPQKEDAWYNKGNTLYRLNKSDEAIKAFDKAIEINSQASYAWYKKGALSKQSN